MPEGHEDLTEPLSDDEQHLAKLGYVQELSRSWSGFSNFAISFSIISILAGCFTSFGLGWNNGGPAAIAWGWPIVSVFILIIGFCLAELVSAYPTSGGIYWWAAKLGGPKAGFYTGWLNLIGLIAILASVSYGSATFLDLTLGTFSESWLAGYSLTRVFIMFLIILAVSAVINIFSSHLLAVINNVSVWWHVAGATAVIAILWLLPEQHASVSDVFAKTINNSGIFSGSTSGWGFLLFVLPISAILTQYTITGYDASAHLSEETKSAANAAAKGIWQSIFYSAIGGWILLLSFLFAVQNSDEVSANGGAVATIFTQALGSKWAGVVLLIATAGQLFCTTACQTSASRMLFAFSRDRAVPGHQLWSKVNATRVPANAVIITAVIAAIITLPAIVPVKIPVNGVEVPSPVAFYAVVSIGVVGLYLCFAVPIYYRWKAGDSFEQGKWNVGDKYKWMAPIAIVEIIVTSIIAMFPTSLGGMPWDPSFQWKFVNYTPLLVGGVLVLLFAYWHVSVKHWFTGPIKQVDAAAAELQS
ncbi:amino acid permease [Mycolicibacterium conceptionense]|jgi:amino acid transporter|uniref:Amino acid permease n=2 Tax=Mycolicibacterium TaxID=1866885 RepID=A0ABR5FSN7_9MYCO|nr:MULTISPECIES: amino acid permease [Mycolicibacterium]KLI05965.1 amino acid permease [Mycolicibacterium senegalense]KLO50966.1 amino acid permease [Mycolicibacterium senegalense]KMV17933.1 amino acid permease [Mycolicibacterium conceptionense]OBK07559.1 amino acid permease [Mycolicibacterium conceptionense]OMB83644.1 amino acid permease [Mycolicibacterium conceptionense]